MVARRRVILFLVCAALGVVALPAAQQFSVRKVEQVPWFSRSLFTFDRALGWASSRLVRVGISVNPGQVIVGYDQWRYLGESYQNPLFQQRQASTPREDELNEEILSNGEAWNNWLLARGVKMYRIMVPPNKDTIYPEYRPRWAAISPDAASRKLVRLPNHGAHVFLEDALRAAAQPGSPLLFYRSDTHWNNYGAWLGYQAFAQQVAPFAPEIQWIPQAEFAVVGYRERLGGDLARFLRIQWGATEEEPILHPSVTEGVVTTETKIPFKGILPNDKMIPLVRHHTSNALNNATLLWLTDSFGDNLQPFIDRTFRDVLSVYWTSIAPHPKSFATIVEKHKPDYVIVTVVERYLHDPALKHQPPG